MKVKSPFVTVKPPRCVILFPVLVKVAAPLARPVRVSAVTAPPDASIDPVLEVSDTCWPVAVRAPTRSNV